MSYAVSESCPADIPYVVPKWVVEQQKFKDDVIKFINVNKDVLESICPLAALKSIKNAMVHASKKITSRSMPEVAQNDEQVIFWAFKALRATRAWPYNESALRRAGEVVPAILAAYDGVIADRAAIHNLLVDAISRDAQRLLDELAALDVDANAKKEKRNKLNKVLVRRAPGKSR